MASAIASLPAETERQYRQLEERLLLRDQVGASQVWYGLAREGRPMPEMLRETIRATAPYLHIPFHQRIDNGVVRFVNNDHCLLSASAALRLTPFMDRRLTYLPVAQTIWYVPTGLDPWNQLLGHIPGHYARRGSAMESGSYPMPSIHWPDQEPETVDGSLEERLNLWLTLVQTGDVLRAYRIFLGLLEEEEDREPVWAQLVFAGLIDVQDRMLYNRSYTTGHRAYRARATVQLSEAIGFEESHSIVYAGVPDLAVGPHWYSAYEMAGEVAWRVLAEAPELQKSSLAPTPSLLPERRLLANSEPLSDAESELLLNALRQPEPAHIDAVSALLLAGKDPKAIVDVFQIAAAQLLLEVGDGLAYTGPQHCAQYMNTLGWWFRRFNHPHRLKVLYVAGSFLTQVSHLLQHTPGCGTEPAPWTRRDLSAHSQDEHLASIDDATVRKNAPETVSWVKSYLAQGYDRWPLVQVLALGAAKHGNDTHNQEIALGLLEDWTTNQHPKRDRLLLAAAQHNAGHIKYGDSLEAYRRFTEAVGIHSTQTSETDRDPREALLDD